MNENYYQLFEFDLRFENARLRLEDFGNRFFYERKIINKMGEKVLIESQLPLINNLKSTPMETAIKTIVENLEKLTPLDGFLLEDIEKTMNIIWDGEQWEN